MYVKTDNDAVNQTKLADVFYVDEAYSKNHAHMLHKHKGILELLYVSEGEGRYIVGSREYAVAAGDLIICNAETIHGEAPFQAHTMQTYCCALSGVHKQALPPGCLISSYQRPVLQLNQYQKPIGQIMPNIYELHIASPRNSDICRQMAISVLLMVEQALDLHGKQERNQIEQKNETLIRQITEYLDHHYTESLSLAEIAKHMHISTSYLSHIFQARNGSVPHTICNPPPDWRSAESFDGNQSACACHRRTAGFWQQLPLDLHVQKICRHCAAGIPQAFFQICSITKKPDS